VKFPDKKRSYNARRRGPFAPTLYLNNITTASHQAMISQAVENERKKERKKSFTRGHVKDIGSTEGIQSYRSVENVIAFDKNP
jgi:hypothetical protein